ncbi:GLPGLI family protein [Bizionia sediminis]|uniref:GLPGLI family protein n=1 Tax=Bizionia sediminis TaxID=1737064 RepID=A0ABW5KUF6_9FLAO
MKTQILLYAIIISCLNLWSQKKGIVYYGQIESIGLKGPHGPDFNSFLLYNSNESYYVSAKDSLDSKTEFKKVYDNADGSEGLAYAVYTTPLGKQVYYNRKKDSIYWSQWNNFYVAEKTPRINWKLETETKKIGKFTVNKATGEFRGRIYTAWYTLEVPLPFGPWKLQGLPGLILEAYDKDKEMYLYFKSLEYPTDNQTAIAQIRSYENQLISWKSLDDFKERLDKMYERMRNSSITIAQKLNTDVPEQKVKSEALLESF